MGGDGEHRHHRHIVVMVVGPGDHSRGEWYGDGTKHHREVRSSEWDPKKENIQEWRCCVHTMSAEQAGHQRFNLLAQR